MAEPFSLSAGIVSLVALALQLVVGTLGMIDKTIAAQQEAADELKNLQEDLEDLQTQMAHIHGTLEVLASNTKDRGFKELLRDYHGEAAIDELCTALDETFVALERLTGQTKTEELMLSSRTLPANTRSLEFVQAVLKHNLAPSKTTNLLRCLCDVRSEIQKCLRKLENSFQYLWTLYIAMTNGLTRVATNGSNLSTSTTLTARIKLVDWLKDREDTWKFPRRRKVATNGPIGSDSPGVPQPLDLTAKDIAADRRPVRRPVRFGRSVTMVKVYSPVHLPLTESTNASEPQASGSGPQTQRPDTTHHG